MTSYILYVGDISIWTFVDITSGIPTFVNVLVLLVLSKQYFVLLKDYKARYLGVGKVDKNTKLFYEDIKGEKMTHIYYNGKVFTGDENLQQAFVVENKKFIYVGNNEEALKYKDENSKLIDLDEKFVCPGFNDSHMHVLGYGYSLKMINLARKTSSLEEMKMQ